MTRAFCPRRSARWSTTPKPSPPSTRSTPLRRTASWCWTCAAQTTAGPSTIISSRTCASQGKLWTRWKNHSHRDLHLDAEQRAKCGRTAFFLCGSARRCMTACAGLTHAASFCLSTSVTKRQRGRTWTLGPPAKRPASKSAETRRVSTARCHGRVRLCNCSTVPSFNLSGAVASWDVNF